MNALHRRLAKAKQTDSGSQSRFGDIIQRGKRLLGSAGADTSVLQTSRETKLESKPKSSKPTVGAASSHNGGTVDSRLNGGIDDMPTMEQIFARGDEIYQKLQPALEAEHLYEHVCINVETGEYVLGRSVREVHRKFEERFGDMPSWDTRIGAPTRVSFGAGAL